jgi:methionyl-tRNA formyltransferase
VPTLEGLLAGPHEVVAVVSQPDRPRGRGRRLAASPVSLCAQRAGVPLLRPESGGGAKDPALMEALRSFAPDIGVVVAFGQFLPRSVRELPKRGYLINAHASLLPKYRGAAPIARAVLAGETRTGISVMRVERQMDAGPVALVRELEIGADENTGQLEPRMAKLAAEAIAEALSQIAAGTIEFVEQDHAAATEAPKLSREDGRLDWSEGSEALVRRIRALSPSPGAFTSSNGELLRIHSARRCDSCPTDPAAPTAPGTVGLHDDPPLTIATGDGFIAPLIVQRAGGRALAIDAFLRGRALPDGVRLGEVDG